jgi:hypothetical protein
MLHVMEEAVRFGFAETNADAFVIEAGGATAGIVFAVAEGVQFAASDQLYWSIDGRIFESIAAARRAIEQLHRVSPNAFLRGRFRRVA